MPKYNFGLNTKHLDTHTARIAGVKGEVVILLHNTEAGFVYEAVFCAEIATQPVYIGERFYDKPTAEQIEQAKRNFKPYIERQKQLREGWH